MASQASTGGTSRLAQMQMRFQQRQQQEREQRRLELNGSEINETDIARSSLKTAKTSNIGNGKVRQMFDERRRGAGIDRGNPLKPISSSSKAISTPTLAPPTQQKGTSNKVYGVRSQETVGGKVAARKTTTTGAASNTNNKQTPKTSSRNGRAEKLNEQNGNGVYKISTNGNSDDIDGEFISKGFGDSITNDSNNNNYNNQQQKKYNGTTTPNIKLNPVLTKKSPPARAPIRQASSSTSSASRTGSTRQLNGSAQNMKNEMIGSARSTNKTPNSVKSPIASARSMAASPEQPKGPPPAGMVACRICGRHFNQDRIVKHEQVCERMAKSKRKVFDASKHRVKGTEAEQFNRKKPAGRTNQQRQSNYVSQVAISGQNIQPKKSNWRQKHEEFITAIRAAKQVQAHLARGGKLSDLPPPPPSENPDYIQCPHCLRRFNETAAERHIPKCATMLHNKPKPGAAANQQQQKRR